MEKQLSDLNSVFSPFQSGIEYTGWGTWRGLRSKGSAVFQADSKTLAVEIPEIQFQCEEKEFLMEKVLTWVKGRTCSGRS